jgi:hypothetical protein
VYKLLAKAFHYDLWGAAFIMAGGCSDDSFENFRAWLILQGKEKFESALKDPNSFTQWVDPKLHSLTEEEFLSLAIDVFEECSEDDIDEKLVIPEPILKGKPWDEEDLPERFPVLSLKFG